MIYQEVIATLKSCKNLAERFDEEGIENVQLTENDTKALRGFLQVLDEGWLGENGVMDAAALSQSDLAMLISAASTRLEVPDEIRV